ncbi:MAG: hypothetical protein SWQ30_08770 [Thermodesulfobacteriota bacterium]|nr:hypothetical protein [Thermodesulfobacteriota bacterium]
MNELIEFTEETVTFYADAPSQVGTKRELVVKLPEGILLKSFSLTGTITGCKFMSHHGSSCYVLEMEMGALSPMNKKILDAYRDFLERESMLTERRVYMKAAQEAFQDFGANLRRLSNTAEEARQIMQGTLELAKRTAEGKSTIH